MSPHLKYQVPWQRAHKDFTLTVRFQEIQHALFRDKSDIQRTDGGKYFASYVLFNLLKFKVVLIFITWSSFAKRGVFFKKITILCGDIYFQFRLKR